MSKPCCVSREPRASSVSRPHHIPRRIRAVRPGLQKRLDKKHSAVVFALQLEALSPAIMPAFRRYSKFPSIRRDLAIVVDDAVTADALLAVVRTAAGEILQQVLVFDIYRGKGVDSRRKSVGLGLILQDASRTLTDEDADTKTRSVMLSLEREFGATIRT